MSSLARVVFERAPEKSTILAEMQRLRRELEPMRRRLQRSERQIFYGKGTRVTDALNDWKRTILELEKTFGDEPHLVSVNNLLRFGREVSEVSDDPTNAKNWVGFLLGLPFSVASRILSRRPAIELHRLRAEVPGANRLVESVRRLFGSVVEDD